MDKICREKLKKYDDGDYVFDAIWGDWIVVMKTTLNTEITYGHNTDSNKRFICMHQQYANELEVIEFIHKFDQDIEVPKEIDDIVSYFGKDSKYNKYMKYITGEILKANTNNIKKEPYKGIPYVHSSEIAFCLESTATHNSYTKYSYDEADVLHGEQAFLVEDIDNELAYGYTYIYDHGICTSYEVRTYNLNYTDLVQGQPKVTLISTRKSK